MMKKFSGLISATGLFAGLLLTPSDTSALTYGFDRITSNAPINVEDQFTFSLTSLSSHQLLFKLENSGSVSSVITSFYFDDADGSSAVLNDIYFLTGGSGVQFSLGGSPPNLPAGNSVSPKFKATAGLYGDAENPSPSYGISPGEWLNIYVNLKPARTLEDVSNSLASGNLRLGLHVQSINGGTSDSFINAPVAIDRPEIITPPGDQQTAVPEGATTLALLSLACAAVETVRRKVSAR